jgi:hypothetical protein
MAYSPFNMLFSYEFVLLWGVGRLRGEHFCTGQTRKVDLGARKFEKKI